MECFGLLMLLALSAFRLRSDDTTMHARLEEFRKRVRLEGRGAANVSSLFMGLCGGTPGSSSQSDEILMVLRTGLVPSYSSL